MGYGLQSTITLILPYYVMSGKSDLACEQTLRSDLAAGWEKEGQLAATSVEFEFCLQFPCGSPLTELSDFRQSA